MAIEGPVRELALSDLLQLLFLSRRTGSLIVRDDAAAQTVILELEAGSLAGATGTSPETRLGRLLVGSGRATDAQVQRALGAQRGSPELRVGEILSDMGAVRAAEIKRHLRYQIEEAVFDLMRWEDGMVRFEERPPAESRAIEVRLPTDAVLMEAVRRLDEWTEVTGAAADPLPRLAGAILGTDAPLVLQPVEWEVLAKVDGENSLKRIARGLGRPELEVARAIYSLVAAGVVEVGGRGTSIQVNGADPLENEIRQAASALLEGRMEQAERRVDELLAERPASAPLQVLRGRILARKRDWRGAIRTFDRAIELDPLSPAAYFHLARAAMRGGQLTRAAEALETYRRLPDSSLPRRQAAERLAASLAGLLGALEEEAE